MSDEIIRFVINKLIPHVLPTEFAMEPTREFSKEELMNYVIQKFNPEKISDDSYCIKTSKKYYHLIGCGFVLAPSATSNIIHVETLIITDGAKKKVFSNPKLGIDIIFKSPI